MSSEKSKADLLAARDGRQEVLVHALAKGYRTTVFLSLNIPGRDKAPRGADSLFVWAVKVLLRAFPLALLIETRTDALGPYALFGIDDDPFGVKRQTIALESSAPAARLLDLDVYASDGEQIGRQALGLPGRACLVCPDDAVACMREQRHDYAEVVARAQALLAQAAY